MTAEALMASHGPAVRARVSRIVGGQDSDDVCQQVWMTVVRKLHTFRGDAQASTWLYRVATNAALDHLRVRNRLAWQAAPLAALREAAHPLDRAGCPHVALAAREALDAVVRRCPAGQRQALAHVALGRSMDETARLTGTPAGTVKSRVHRMRRVLGGEP